MNQDDVAFVDLKIDPEHLAHLAGLIEEKKITSRQAKDMLARMFETGLDPEEIVKKENVGVSGTEEVQEVVVAIIAENKAAADDYRKGKIASMQFLIGKAMAKLKGRAQPDMLKDLFERNLK